MEGEQRKSDSKQAKGTPENPGKVVAGSSGDAVEKSSVNVPSPAASRMIALEALIRGVKAPHCRWPKEVLRAVIDRFGRISRGGWPLSCSLFYELFKCEIRLDELKMRADSAITNYAGGKCEQKQFIEKSTKHAKRLDTYFEERTLHEAKVYLEIKQKYLALMQEARDREINKPKWTQKIALGQVDLLILRAVNQAVREFAAQYPPMSMSDIARQLQVAQLCYEEATVKERKPTSLRSDIEKKIADNTTSKALVKRNVAGETFSVKELTEARECMRSFNFILELKCDSQKAISILEERIKVYTSKIASHAF
ncbi:hypothetical protein PAEPH01_2079 [Pancytospora epiphaga]|nr:hypothetical protein PAEPH01_2079 [Pancytospora epiphaga]